jgi:hypothetical protein
MSSCRTKIKLYECCCWIIKNMSIILRQNLTISNPKIQTNVLQLSVLAFHDKLLTMLVVCIRAAVLTVSPNRQYRGTFRPTTPATTGPEWIPVIQKRVDCRRQAAQARYLAIQFMQVSSSYGENFCATLHTIEALYCRNKTIYIKGRL